MFLLVTPVPLMAIQPYPVHPRFFFSHVPFEFSMGLGFNCLSDTSTSGNLIFVDLCFLSRLEEMCPPPWYSLPTVQAGMWPAAGWAASPAGRKETVVMSVQTAQEPGDSCPGLAVD